MSKRLSLLFLFLATSIFCPELARASTLDLVAQSGTWGATCPAVVCSAPGDSWSYSFLTNSTLVFDESCCWDSPATDFEYELNGQPVDPPYGIYGGPIYGPVRFFPGYNDGGFDFANPSPIYFGSWVQLFSPLYPSNEAELVPGIYPVNPSLSAEGLLGGCYGYNGACGAPSQQLGFYAGPVVITALPEPYTSGLTLIGIALLLLMRKKMPLSSKMPL
jgi:hypothetical protein